MKQIEFIAAYEAAHPTASLAEVLAAWQKELGRLGGEAAKTKRKDKNSITITAFCDAQGISRMAYYKNKAKYLPLYAEYLKNHTKNNVYKKSEIG